MSAMESASDFLSYFSFYIECYAGRNRTATTVCRTCQATPYGHWVTDESPGTQQVRHFDALLIVDSSDDAFRTAATPKTEQLFTLLYGLYLPSVEMANKFRFPGIFLRLEMLIISQYD